MSYPIVIRAKLPSHCPHCHLPVEVGEPIANVGDTPCQDANYGWEHAFHHTRSFEAADAWGLYDDDTDIYPTPHRGVGAALRAGLNPDGTPTPWAPR